MKQYWSNDGCFDKDGGSEDSDCESGLDQSGHSVTGAEVSGKKESEWDSLPVLSIGSFAG